MGLPRYDDQTDTNRGRRACASRGLGTGSARFKRRRSDRIFRCTTGHEPAADPILLPTSRHVGELDRRRSLGAGVERRERGREKRTLRASRGSLGRGPRRARCTGYASDRVGRGPRGARRTLHDDRAWLSSARGRSCAFDSSLITRTHRFAVLCGINLSRARASSKRAPRALRTRIGLSASAAVPIRRSAHIRRSAYIRRSA